MDGSQKWKRCRLGLGRNLFISCAVVASSPSVEIPISFWIYAACDNAEVCDSDLTVSGDESGVNPCSRPHFT
jgi:hypothetical protein